MAVIINDFEVIMDQAQPTDNTNSQSQSTSAPMLRPDEIVRIVRHYQQRKLRLLAD